MNEETIKNETEKTGKLSGNDKLFIGICIGTAAGILLSRKSYQRGFEKGIKLIIKNLK